MIPIVAILYVILSTFLVIIYPAFEIYVLFSCGLLVFFFGYQFFIYVSFKIL